MCTSFEIARQAAAENILTAYYAYTNDELISDLSKCLSETIFLVVRFFFIYLSNRLQRKSSEAVLAGIRKLPTNRVCPDCGVESKYEFGASLLRLVLK